MATYNEIATGGAAVGGIADASVIYNPTITAAGAEGGGAGDESVFFLAQGGATVGGTANVQATYNADGTGGGVVGDPEGATSSQSRFIRFTGSGVVTVGGEISGGVTGVRYNPTGEVEIGGDAFLGMTFNVPLIFLWNTRTFVRRDLTFLWNTGQLQAFFYRVVGKKKDDDECLPKEDCCQQVIINISARTLAELCEKLSKRSFIGPIESVQKFARPVDLSFDTDGDALPEDLCEGLEPIEVCDIPACADFCIDHDLQETVGFESQVQVDAFYIYESTGNIFVSGTATTSSEVIIPDFPYEAEGGVEIDEDEGADYISSGYAGIIDGEEIIIGGSADVVSSAYSYIGGMAPVSFFDTPADVSEFSNDGETWLLPQRALLEDGLTALSDVSFGKSSELLVIRGFDFDIPIPSGSFVTGIRVTVKRYADTTGIRDEQLYLVVGNEIISDNLADTTNDWPLINTSKVYGSDGFDGNTPWRDPEDLEYLGEWDLDDVGDDEFGLAIAVNNLSSPQSGAIARIDFVSIEVFWEDPDHQRVRTGGEAGVVSSAYSWVGEGGITLDSENIYRKSGSFISGGLGFGNGPAFTIGGSYGKHESHEVDFCEILTKVGHGAKVSGWADVSPYIYTEYPIGFTEMGGEAEVTDAAVSLIGAKMGGEAHVSPIPFVASGGMGAGGAAKVTPYIETASGGMVINGEITQSQPTIGGSAEYKSSYVEEVASGGAGASGAAKVTPYVETTSGGVRGSVPHYVKFDSERLATMSSVNICDGGDCDLARLSDVSSGAYGHAYKRFSNLDPNTQYTVTLTGITDDSNDSPNNSLVAELGTAVLYLYQWDGLSVTTVATGIVTADSNGEAVMFVLAHDGSGGTGSEESHVRLLSVEFEAANDVSVIYTEPQGDPAGVEAGGESQPFDFSDFSHEAEGGVEVSGEVATTSSAFTWVADGAAVFILGGATVEGLVTVTDTFAYSISVFDTVVNFVDDETTEIEPSVGSITRCGCDSLPLSVQMSHNMFQNNNFAQFLVRNNFTLPRITDLLYNAGNDSWQANHHFTGWSTSSGVLENWDVVFELQCTDEIGGINIGRDIWKFAVQVNRKNLSTLEDFDTRLILGIIPDTICASNSNLTLEINWDTDFDAVTIFPDSAVYQARLYDNIGLFKNAYWENNPSLVFNLTETTLDEPVRTISLAPFLET